MKTGLSIFLGGIGAIHLALALIKLVRTTAEIWANRKVRRFFRDCKGGVKLLWNSLFKLLLLLLLEQPRHRRVVPGSPLSARIWHWVGAGILCVYVAFLLTLAAVIATVAAFAVPSMTELNPIAEPTAVLFVCLLWVVADFFYKEALILRSEVTGLPALET
jgi:hypothetical protein